MLVPPTSARSPTSLVVTLAEVKNTVVLELRPISTSNWTHSFLSTGLVTPQYLSSPYGNFPGSYYCQVDFGSMGGNPPCESLQDSGVLFAPSTLGAIL